MSEKNYELRMLLHPAIMKEYAEQYESYWREQIAQEILKGLRDARLRKEGYGDIWGSDGDSGYTYAMHEAANIARGKL